MSHPLLITAHRGSSALAPENTLASLRQAIADGADSAEVDVQVTTDGELVLFHDDDLQRICGDPRLLRELAYDEISHLDVGRWFSPQFAGERVPRLADAIALSQQAELKLNLELKAACPSPDFACRVVQQVDTLGFAQHCVLTSFNRDLLYQVRQLMPHGTLGLICDTAPGPAEDWLNLYSLAANAVTPELVARLHSQNKALHVWTVNQPETMQRLIRAEVDSIITDSPALLRQVLKQEKQLD